MDSASSDQIGAPVNVRIYTDGGKSITAYTTGIGLSWIPRPQTAPSPGLTITPPAEVSKVLSPSTPPSQEDYKVVDPNELFIGAGKYLGKNVEIRNYRCYYADVGDYRCATQHTQLSIFTKTISPTSSKDWIEQNCDTMEKMARSDKCIVSIRLRFNEDEVDEDIISGYEKRKVIRPANGVIIVPREERSRRRR